MDRRLVIGIVSFSAFFFVLGMYLMSYGAEPKEVTISGDLVCGHCTLHALESCGVALKGEHENYFLVKNDESDKVFDKRHNGLKATVTGTVEEKDGKKWITASKIELEEK